MAKTLYFNGEIELANVQPLDNAEFAKRFPGVKGRRYDGFTMKVGRVASEKPVYVQGQGWVETLLPVERVINFKSNPSRHECDARCMNATGKTMNCECSCGGKNHGRGAFQCSEAA
jgi:hypothetical protein